jgi:MFS family permease
MKSTSTWFALRNPVFCRLWAASVLSGTFLAAQDMSATWLMHDLGASSLSLSLMATAASAPFFLFTLPAGAFADIVNRRALIMIAVLWQGACSAFLAVGAWAQAINTNIVLGCIFALGIGLAFGAPVLGAIVPDLVDKEELPSAITLGGVQLNLSGIVGPALGGFLLPIFGAPFAISVNALMFLLLVFALLQWKPRPMELASLPENFAESFISSLRYARNSRRMRIILFRNLLFSLVISIVPALLPVIALKVMQLSAAQLGLVFTCVGVGSLTGAVVALPYLRERTSPNAITSISMAIMVLVLLAMGFFRQLPTLMLCATLAGVAWALAGSELWVAGQRVIPGWVRGRMNSLQIMLGQGGIAVGALIWGSGVVHAGLELTFSAAAVLALSVLAIGHRFSIDFASEASVDAAPLNQDWNFPACPDHDDGPVTVTIEYAIARQDRQQFYALMQEIQAALRRNGAFDCRLDENLYQPGRFRLEFQTSTWAEHIRQTNRITVDERQVFNAAWDLHAADSNPIVQYYLSSQECVFPNNFGFIGRTFSNTSGLLRRSLAGAASSSQTRLSRGDSPPLRPCPIPWPPHKGQRARSRPPCESCPPA